MFKTLLFSCATVKAYDESSKEDTSHENGWRNGWECADDCADLFSDYLDFFEKSYSTNEEYQMRYFYFKESLKAIDAVNKHARPDYLDDLKLNLNEFSDWSLDEFDQLLSRGDFIEPFRQFYSNPA